MAWLQLSIDSTPDSASEIETSLLLLGAQGVTLEDNADEPIFEPALGETPLWRDTRITGLFEADCNVNQISASIEKAHAPASYRWSPLEDKDWVREWMNHFEPIHCGHDLWICPSWKDPVDEHAVNLLLDPGLAFGTGTHPTTFMCLQWLSGHNVSEKQVLDYGCGSGILAIAAHLLGAKHLTCVDIDPQALMATQENAARNGLTDDALDVYLPQQRPANDVFDIVLANILAGPLVDLAPSLLTHLNTGAYLCLSGLLASQAESVMDAYKHQIKFEPVVTHEEWAMLVGYKL